MSLNQQVYQSDHRLTTRRTDEAAHYQITMVQSVQVLPTTTIYPEGILAT